MTSAAKALSEPAASPARPRAGSFRASLVEFILVGGGTLGLFPLAWLYRAAVGRKASEIAVDFMAFHAAVLINNPHFAVTYLLFYKDARKRALGPLFAPAQRARYLAAGLIAPIAMIAWMASALASHSARALGMAIQLMFFLVGWHYVKQGFGILSVLSARRGVRFSPFERKVVLTHCFTGWAYAWASPAEPGRELEEAGVLYHSIAHPPWLERLTFILFASSTLALIVVLARKWRRERSLPLVPLAGFLITVWSWTIYSSLDPLVMYVIPALHSIQYLYMVWLLKRNEAREAEGPPLFGRPTALRLGVLAVSAIALGWLLFRGAPSFLDGALVLAPTAGDRTTGLGATPYFAAIFVFVNIHHYLMDTVIWRRDNPDTRFLRDAPAAKDD